MISYGKDCNNVSSQFHFDKVYPNRFAMEENCKLDDGIAIGRFVLVFYGGPEKYADLPPETENFNYSSNEAVDSQQYGENFNRTVWEKIYINNVFVYIMVARLDIDLTIEANFNLSGDEFVNVSNYGANPTNYTISHKTTSSDSQTISPEFDSRTKKLNLYDLTFDKAGHLTNSASKEIELNIGGNEGQSKLSWIDV